MAFKAEMSDKNQEASTYTAMSPTTDDRFTEPRVFDWHQPTSHTTPPPSCMTSHYGNPPYRTCVSTCKLEEDDRHYPHLHRAMTSSSCYNGDVTTQGLSQANGNYFLSCQSGFSGAVPAVGQTSERHADAQYFSSSFSSLQHPLGPSSNFPCVFPSMNVNVSMNMNLHGMPPTHVPPMTSQNLYDVNPYSGSRSRDWSARGAFNQSATSALNNGDSGSESDFTSVTSPFESHVSLTQQPAPASSFHANYYTGATHAYEAGALEAGFNEWRPSSQPVRPIPFGARSFANQRLFSSFNARHDATGARLLTSPWYDMRSRLSDAKTNACPICNKTYARPSTLKTHMRIHSGEKPFKCPSCSRCFSQAANLTAHARTHSGEKPFSCSVCHRRFSQSSSVTTHMRTHTKEKPFTCVFCKKQFSDSSTLTKHKRTHTNEKPYQCDQCQMRFSQSGNLTRHKRIHEANYAK